MTVFLSFCRCFSWFLHLFPCNSLIISNIIVHWKSIFWQFFGLCHPRLLARLSGVVKMLVQNLLKTQTCPCLWCSKSIFNLRGIKIAIFPIRKAKKGGRLVKIGQNWANILFECPLIFIPFNSNGTCSFGLHVPSNIHYSEILFLIISILS